MLLRPHSFRLCLVVLAWGLTTTLRLCAQEFHVWTVLVPEKDSRDEDTRSYDDFDSRSLVATINEEVDVFHHRLSWRKVAIKDLLSSNSPFCELRFDAVKPLRLTDQEKTILQEYFARGGFIVFQEDAYPYSQDEFWNVHSWPLIDFITKELPAASSDFAIEKITDAHPLFHQRYNTQTSELTKHELQDNPHTPNRTLLTYQHRPCAFVFGRYNLIKDGKWVALPRPFAHDFSLESRGYQLTVNLYMYAVTH